MNSVEELAHICKALSDPTRLKLIIMLGGCNCDKECINLCVNAMTSKLNVSQSAVSQHLRVLKQAHLVKAERMGYHVHYSIDMATFERFRDQINNIIGLS